MRRVYTREHMEDCWDCCSHDFKRFLDLLDWIDGLSDAAAAEQLDPRALLPSPSAVDEALKGGHA